MTNEQIQGGTVWKELKLRLRERMTGATALTGKELSWL